MQVNITNLLDDVQCYQTVRELRWPDGIECPSCQSTQIIKRGFDDTESACQQRLSKRGQKLRRLLGLKRYNIKQINDSKN